MPTAAPEIGDILSLLNESDQRDLDRAEFTKAQVILWLISAIDGHPKNYSTFIRPSGFVLTPLHDVLYAAPHVNPTSLSIQKTKLVMSVGNHHPYKVQEILLRHWRQTALKYNFRNIDSIFEEIKLQAELALKEVSSKSIVHFPTSGSDLIYARIAKANFTSRMMLRIEFPKHFRLTSPGSPLIYTLPLLVG